MTRGAGDARGTRVLLLALALTISGWVPAPARGEPLPPTFVHSVAVDPPSVPGMAAARRHRVCAPTDVNAVGFTWRGRGEVDVAVADAAGGVETLHEEVGEGPDPASAEASHVRGTPLLWLGRARCISVVVTRHGGGAVHDMRAVFVQSHPGSVEARGAGGLGVAEAQPARPWIVTRSQWGADESMRNCDPSYAPAVKMGFVHHTAGTNDYSPADSAAIVRGIYAFHTVGRGWCDIAYNLLVDRYGTVFEGRAGGISRPVIPAATMGFNTGSFAVAALGEHTSAAVPAPLLAAIEKVFAWRLDLAHMSPTEGVWMLSRGSTGGKYPPGKWVWMRTVSGHRDAGYTDCPGGNLYALLPDIRSGAYAIGLPKIFRPTQSRRAFTPVKESVTWGAYASEEVTWTVQVTDVSGAVVRSWTSSGKTLSLTWNGQNALGVPVPEGRYRVRIAARSTADARPAAFTVEVEPLLPSALALSRARPRPPVNRAGEP